MKLKLLFVAVCFLSVVSSVVGNRNDNDDGHDNYNKNLLKAKTGKNNKARRFADNDISSSSSLEMPKWKEEWNDQRVSRFIESMKTEPKVGDEVNMIAARPWGVPCGDPEQHDMPWGSCMLPMECEPEYRVYRGDYFCGRTNFICCAILLRTFDPNVPIDISPENTELEVNSDEYKENNFKNSAEKREKKRRRDKKKRQNRRDERKRKLKKTIKKINKEIKKILDRAYRNGTREKRRKTKELKSFIEYLKKKFKKDRKAVKEIHEIEMIKVEGSLMQRLQQIRTLNHNFMTNSTFREILEKGMMSKQAGRMLLQAYPELSDVMPDFVTSRRMGVDLDNRQNLHDSDKSRLKYDLEYGYLYYDK